MKNQAYINFLIRSSLAMTLVFTLGIWSPGQSQPAKPVEMKNRADAKMMESCKDMKLQKQKMKDEMKAQDAQLTDKITEMNLAQKDKKIDLMAALLTQMVEQRIAMDARKAKMEQEMMTHMMQHMQMGKESMSKCPMMKDMNDMDEKSGNAHKDHQKPEDKEGGGQR